MPVKPVRSLSGIAVVAVMAPAFKCPGRCVYCFRGDFAAQSYTGLEPAARRARMLNFDPYLQAKHRIEQLARLGHVTQKLEVIILGGTFNFFSRKFQEWFVKRIFDAANKRDAKTLEEAHKLNENAEHRIIGLTFETRPDYASIEELIWLRKLGATRIELGVQSLYDDVLELVKRDHGVKESIEATRNAKDLGYKVCYHIMPGLPGSNARRDIEMFRRLFSDERFQPDMLKIYPTLVIKGSELYEWWKQGKYRPLSTREAVEIIARGKLFVPPWVRIMRVQRDVPVNAVSAGIDVGNLRELVWKRLAEMGKRCRCIRCREVREELNLDLELVERRYEASGAVEVFLSFEDLEKDKIVAFLRLRLLRRFLLPELEDSAIIREVRVYGPATRLGEVKAWQHRGLGRKLIEKAKEIASTEGYSRLSVISGVGVRPYFRKLGFEDKGLYQVLDLTRHV